MRVERLIRRVDKQLESIKSNWKKKLLREAGNRYFDWAMSNDKHGITLPFASPSMVHDLSSNRHFILPHPSFLLFALRTLDQPSLLYPLVDHLSSIIPIFIPPISRHSIAHSLFNPRPIRASPRIEPPSKCRFHQHSFRPLPRPLPSPPRGSPLDLRNATNYRKAKPESSVRSSK